MLKRTHLMLLILIALIAIPTAFAQEATPEATTMGAAPAQSGYADVNDLHMYYEIYGEGEPVVVLHGAYMNINIMGELIHGLAATRQVIAVEFQGHGRTADIVDRPFSYQQLADDVAALMTEIGVEKADVLGYSLGGSTALQMAIRHPEMVDKLVVISGAYSSAAYYPGFEEMVQSLTPEMFAGTPVVTEYEALAPNPENFPLLMEKLIDLDTDIEDWPDADIQAIAAPTLIMQGDSDTVRPQHGLDMFLLRGGGVEGDMIGLPNSQLAILPATSHIGILFRVNWLVPMITEFLDAPVTE